jgi:hypothetical protein
MASLTCTGIALGFVWMQCTGPDAAPTGKATFCKTMERAIAGGKIRPSRKDTRETKEQADALNAAYDRDCVKQTPK